MVCWPLERLLASEMTNLKGGFIRLIDSPIRYMQARAALGPPRLFSALIPVGITAVVFSGTIWLSQTRMMPVFPPLTGAFILFTGTITNLLIFSFHAGAVIMLDMATAQSRQARRYLELCALAYWPQAFVSIMLFVVTWLYFDPPVMTIQSTREMQHAAAATHGENVARMPFSILTGTVQQFAMVWLIALHATTLRVAAGLTVGGTWGAGITLMAVLMGGPWLAGQVWMRLFS